MPLRFDVNFENLVSSSQESPPKICLRDGDLNLNKSYPTTPFDKIGPKTSRNGPRKNKDHLGNLYIYHLPSQDQISNLGTYH